MESQTHAAQPSVSEHPHWNGMQFRNKGAKISAWKRARAS